VFKDMKDAASPRSSVSRQVEQPNLPIMGQVAYPGQLLRSHALQTGLIDIGWSASMHVGRLPVEHGRERLAPRIGEEQERPLDDVGDVKRPFGSLRPEKS
jgi:hypothetical protein